MFVTKNDGLLTNKSWYQGIWVQYIDHDNGENGKHDGNKWQYIIYTTLFCCRAWIFTKDLIDIGHLQSTFIMETIRYSMTLWCQTRYGELHWQHHNQLLKKVSIPTRDQTCKYLPRGIVANTPDMFLSQHVKHNKGWSSRGEIFISSYKPMISSKSNYLKQMLKSD